MVGQVGVEPTTPEGNGFTARRVCRFATDPYGIPNEIRTRVFGMKIRNLRPLDYGDI